MPKRKPAKKSYQTISLITIRGEVVCQYYNFKNAKSAVVWAGGMQGNWDSPARNLYPELAKKFKRKRISSLRIKYRNSRDLDEAVYDILAGINFLKNQGISKLALVGHSLGGAAVIRAAILTPITRTVVTLAAQSYGTGNADRLPKSTSILLIHGKSDTLISSDASQYIFRHAHKPKKIILLEKDDHSLTKSAAKTEKIIFDWISKKLAK